MSSKTKRCPKCGMANKMTKMTTWEGDRRVKMIGGQLFEMWEAVCAGCGIYYRTGASYLGVKEPVEDPNRFKLQLGEDQNKIRDALKGLAERMEFSHFSTWPVGAKGKTVSMKFEMVMVFDYSDYYSGGVYIHQELFKVIKELEYETVYVFADWQNKKIKIMIEKKVAV